MSENPKINGDISQSDADEASIHVNEYGTTKDGAVLIEEPDRSVLLTNEETVVFEKQPQLEITPANRSRKPYSGMWGTSEIAAVGVASFAVLTVILFYLLAVVPSNRDIQTNRVESNRLQNELSSSQAKYGSITSTESRVTELLASVDDFQMNHLPIASIGKNALYQKINGLIAAYALVNTTGPDYVPLDTIDQNAAQQTDEERGRAKFRSLFPGVYVTMTLDGSYQNLRRFITDIERGNDFIVISSIELEPSDSQSRQTNAPAQDQVSASMPLSPGAPNYNGMMVQPGGQPRSGAIPTQQPGLRGKTHGEAVSLRLELAAYFRRPDFRPVESTTSAATGGPQ